MIFSRGWSVSLYFVYFWTFSSKEYNLNNKLIWKFVHPVSSAGIQTHDLLNTSLLPKPIDQGFQPIIPFGIFSNDIMKNRILPLVSKDLWQVIMAQSAEWSFLIPAQIPLWPSRFLSTYFHQLKWKTWIWWKYFETCHSKSLWKKPTWDRVSSSLVCSTFLLSANTLEIFRKRRWFFV